jgi:ankyrin repeat protein
MRRKRTALITFVLLAALVGATGLWLCAQQRQHALDRALIAALVHGDDKQALALVNQGADPNTRYSATPMPLLHEMWKQLLRLSQPASNAGQTAFMIACGAWWSNDETTMEIQSRRLDALQLVDAMLRHGADLDAKDENGLTPLMWAARFDHRQVTTMLLKHGADVNAPDNDGNTTLLLTMHNSGDNLEMLRLLLAHGANPNLYNHAGYSPMLWAHSDPAVLTLFRQAGARR